jgi:uncharacterized protein YegL
MEELNRGVRCFYDAVRNHDVAKHSVEVAIVGFAGRAKTVREFEPIVEAAAPELEVDPEWGGTSIGGGAALAVEIVEKRKAEYQHSGIEYYQPWLILMTDGQPTDESHVSVAPKVAQLVQARKLTVFPIGIGEGADMNTLAMFSPRRQPLKLKGLQFQELFEFLAQSVAQVSVSQPGEAVQLDPEGVKTWAEV